MNEINWNKYIKYGIFTSKNGIILPFKWEFDRLEKELCDKDDIISCIIELVFPYSLVCINSIHPKELEVYSTTVYFPDTNLLEWKYNPNKLGDYILYDDVITTGKTIENCINKIGYLPKFCLCLIDRRQEVKEIISKSINKCNIELFCKTEVFSVFEILKDFAQKEIENII